MTLLTFTVPGSPVTQGSHRAICVNGHGVLVEGSSDAAKKRFKQWRALVADYARMAAMRPSAPPGLPFTGAVAMTLTFYLERPQRPKDPLWPSARGSKDLDKACRAVFDAITGVLIVDDSQVCKLDASKVYGDRPGLVVSLMALTEGPPAGGLMGRDDKDAGLTVPKLDALPKPTRPTPDPPGALDDPVVPTMGLNGQTRRYR